MPLLSPCLFYTRSHCWPQISFKASPQLQRVCIYLYHRGQQLGSEGRSYSRELLGISVCIHVTVSVYSSACFFWLCLQPMHQALCILRPEMRHLQHRFQLLSLKKLPPRPGSLLLSVDPIPFPGHSRILRDEKSNTQHEWIKDD